MNNLSACNFHYAKFINILVMLQIEPRAFYMLDAYSTTEVHLHSRIKIIHIYVNYAYFLKSLKWKSLLI
jgi:hypothetical protein